MSFPRTFLSQNNSLAWFIKLDACNLVFDGTNYVPPFRNVDQLLKIGFEYIFDSCCILISFYFEENDFFSFNYIFLLKTYDIKHTAKTHLPCSILKCFNQVYECNERRTFFMNKYRIM